MSSSAAYARTVSSIWYSGRVATEVSARRRRLLSIRPATARERFVAPDRVPLTTGKDRRGGLDRKTARQRAETTERALLVRVKQLITPGDRRIDRLLAFGEIAWADGREQDIVAESAEQILGRQHFDPRSRKLEGERQCIEPSANRRHGGAVRGREAKARLHVANAFHEESHRGRAREIGRRRRIGARFQRERSDGVLPLAAHAERSAAGDQQAQRRDRRQRDLRPAAPRPGRARNCRAPATSGDPSHATRARLGKSSAVTSDSPRASAIADATNAGFRVAASGTNTTRVVPLPRSHGRSPAPDGSCRLLLAR